MKPEEIIGLLGLLFGLFLLGMYVGINYTSLAILLTVGSILFFAIYLKNTYATIGLIILAFALLLYFFSTSGIQGLQNENQTQNLTSVSYNFPSYYFPTIILFLLVILALAIAYKVRG